MWAEVEAGCIAGVGLQATPHHGKRRSTRAACRPLEWWRNEHKVYERKHRSALSLPKYINS